MKKIFMLMLVLCLVLGTVASAYAASSTGSVGFGTEGGGGTDPKDPDEGTDPGPEIPGTGDAGPLSLDYVPNMFFGENLSISSTAKTFDYLITDVDKSSNGFDVPFIQVTDSRGGDTAAWNVTLSSSAFTGSKNSKDYTLDGAYITIGAGGIVKTTDADGTPPVGRHATIQCDGTAGRVVFEATTDGTKGTWINQKYVAPYAEGPNDVIQLTVPGHAATAGVNYTASLTWTLQDTP